MKKLLTTIFLLSACMQSPAAEWYEKTTSAGIDVFDWDKIFYAFTERMAAADADYVIPAGLPGEGEGIYPYGETNISPMVLYTLYSHMWTELRNKAGSFAATYKREMVSPATWAEYLDTAEELSATKWTWTKGDWIGFSNCVSVYEDDYWDDSTVDRFPTSIPSWEDEWDQLFPETDIGHQRTYTVKWKGYNKRAMQGWENTDVDTFQVILDEDADDEYSTDYKISGISTWPHDSGTYRHLSKFVLWDGEIRNATLYTTYTNVLPSVDCELLDNQPWRGLLDDEVEPVIVFESYTGSTNNVNIPLLVTSTVEAFGVHDVRTNAALFHPKGGVSPSTTRYTDAYDYARGTNAPNPWTAITAYEPTEFIYPPSTYLQVSHETNALNKSISSLGETNEVGEQAISIKVELTHDGSLVVTNAGVESVNGIYDKTSDTYYSQRDGANYFQDLFGDGYWNLGSGVIFYNATGYSPGDTPDEVSWTVTAHGTNPVPIVISNPNGGVIPGDVHGRLTVMYTNLAQYGDMPKTGLILKKQVVELISLIEAYEETVEPIVWIGNTSDPWETNTGTTAYSGSMFDGSATTEYDESVAEPYIAVVGYYPYRTGLEGEREVVRWVRYAKATVGRSFHSELDADITFYAKSELPNYVETIPETISYDGSDYSLPNWDWEPFQGNIYCNDNSGSSCWSQVFYVGEPVDTLSAAGSDMIVDADDKYFSFASVTNWTAHVSGGETNKYAQSAVIPSTYPDASPPASVMAYYGGIDVPWCGTTNGADYVWDLQDRGYALVDDLAAGNFATSGPLLGGGEPPGDLNIAVQSPTRKAVEYRDAFGVFVWEFEYP